MQKFDDATEVEEWLDTFDYEQFWEQTDPNNLNAEERENCDLSISQGVDKAMILKCIKATKRLEIIREQGLKVRIYQPPVTLH